jgi:hypothetical protein
VEFDALSPRTAELVALRDQYLSAMSLLPVSFTVVVAGAPHERVFSEDEQRSLQNCLRTSTLRNSGGAMPFPPIETQGWARRGYRCQNHGRSRHP